MKFIDSSWIHANSKIFAKRRVVFILGAGVSVSSGIPDFRSESGIFTYIMKKYRVKGEHLFNYRYSLDETSRPCYLDFISLLKKEVDSAVPSPSHLAIKNFFQRNRKCRVYTQNVDSLEEKAGILCDKTKNTQLVYLHGDLKVLRCLYCGYKIHFGPEEIQAFQSLEEIECTKCNTRNAKRQKENKRTLPIGIMHTNIVHYNQPHPDGHHISSINGLDANCNLVIVVGTSLKVHGLKIMLKYFLKNCKENNGVSIFVNRTDPAKEFRELFDYMWKGDSDDFFKEVEAKTPTPPRVEEDEESTVVESSVIYEVKEEEPHQESPPITQKIATPQEHILSEITLNEPEEKTKSITSPHPPKDETLTLIAKEQIKEISKILEESLRLEEAPENTNNTPILKEGTIIKEVKIEKPIAKRHKKKKKK